MPYPDTINRTNINLMELVETIESHDYESNKPLKIKFKDKSKALYKRGQIYAVWRAKKREFKNNDIEMEENPIISIDENDNSILVFSKNNGTDDSDNEFEVIE